MSLISVVPNKTVDARSMPCPLLEAKTAIASVTVGQTLEIMSADAGSRQDIPAWCKKTGHLYLGCVENDGYDSLYVVRKT